jgi:hypothetical protein
MDGPNDGQFGVLAMATVAQGPAVPATMPAGVSIASTTSKGLATPVGPAGALASAVRKGGLTEWWPTTVPAAMLAGAPTAAAAAKEPAAAAVLVAGLLLSLRERMTLGVGAIFWFISHTMSCQPEGLGLHIYIWPRQPSIC